MVLTVSPAFKISKDNILQALLYIGVFLLGFLGTYLILISKINKNKSIIPTPIPENNLFESVQETKEGRKFSAVLLGSGGEGHSGGGLTDSIIVVSVDSESKKAFLISVPRDLWVPGNRKINAEVSANGINSIKSVLNGVTGIEVEKYASVDFGNLIKLIDAMGGIDVEVDKPYDDHFYPIRGLENERCGKTDAEFAALHQKYSGFELEKQFTCRYEHIHFDVGVTKINGETALKFARSRHGDSDFGRSGRQFTILLGVIKKLSTQSPFTDVKKAYEVLSKLVSTDLNLEEAVELFNVLGNPNNYAVERINLSDQNVLVSSKGPSGEYILLPRSGKNNFGGVKEYIKSLTK